MRSVRFSTPKTPSTPFPSHFSAKSRRYHLLGFVGRAEPVPERLRPVISSKRLPRQSTPPPEYKPVEHSAAFILKNKRPADLVSISLLFLDYYGDKY